MGFHPLRLISGKKGAGSKPHKISDITGAPVSGSRSKLGDEGQASQLPHKMSLRGVRLRGIKLQTIGYLYLPHPPYAPLQD